MRIVIANKNQIIIKNVKNVQHKTLAERLKKFKGKYEAEECCAGEVVGKEIW